MHITNFVFRCECCRGCRGKSPLSAANRKEKLRRSLVQGFVQGDSELRSSDKSFDSDMDVLLCSMLLSSCFVSLHSSGVLQDPQREEPNGNRCLLQYPSPESFLLRR